MAKIKFYKRSEENLNKRIELCRKDSWTDSDKLKYILYGIEPYSMYWRLGMVSALRHAIKLLEREEKGDGRADQHKGPAAGRH